MSLQFIKLGDVPVVTDLLNDWEKLEEVILKTDDIGQNIKENQRSAAFFIFLTRGEEKPPYVALLEYLLTPESEKYQETVIKELHKRRLLIDGLGKIGQEEAKQFLPMLSHQIKDDLLKEKGIVLEPIYMSYKGSSRDDISPDVYLLCMGYPLAGRSTSDADNRAPSE